jgi:nitrogen-specific signal transduction histidine kinase
MFLVSYLAHDTQYLEAVQERLALASPPMGMVSARSVPEAINHIQTLPVRAVIIDISWPREAITTLADNLRQLHPGLSLLALTPAESKAEWWQLTDDLLRLDEPLDLFLHRLERGRDAAPHSQAAPAPPAPSTGQTAPERRSLLSTAQFRQFAEIFSGMDEETLTESFVAWVQQACQTSRTVMLLRDSESGNFVCRAQRGLPSSLVPHCSFPQTSPLCRWLTTSSRILIRDHADDPLALEALAELTLIQADTAVPVMFDGQLVGILGIGPRLFGQGYTPVEMEALFAIGSQVASSVHHCRLHRALRGQQEMTEHMLSVIPTGALVLGEDQRIAFVNAAAATILGNSRAALFSADLRSLPSPLGDLAYESLVKRQDLTRRELEVSTISRPLAVSCYVLDTTPPSAMLLIEDLTAQKRLEVEHDRRVNLEVLTNLVHYLAHELRNPLVALSTFSALAPERANDPDFKEFCESVLQGEIGRVNLILEQLLVLTDHVELQFHHMDLMPVLDRVTGTEEMRAAVVTSFPVGLPMLYADEQRLETALTCILRTAVRLSFRQTPVTMKVSVNTDVLEIHVETPIAPGIAPEQFLNPWQQFIELSEEDVDLGLATAQYIVEQHEGILDVSSVENVLAIACRLPLRAELDNLGKENSHDAPQSARRRR